MPKKDFMSTILVACPICLFDAEETRNGGHSRTTQCIGCGKFTLTGTALAVWQAKRGGLTSRQISNARSWLRNNPDLTLNSADVEKLGSVAIPSVGERAELLLKAIEKNLPDISAKIHFPLNSPKLIPWMSISWCQTQEELIYLLESYLERQKAWIHKTHSQEYMYRVSPQGYEHLDDLQRGDVNSNTGFCAMWFGDEVSQIWSESIKPAIEMAGYEAIRIDSVQHNNRIDDEILAYIRRSKFVIADFTGERGGVYFEAGFALGLGRQVIWTVREDELKNVHFDNRQYNFLQWTPDRLDDFKIRLHLRIEATIGRGNKELSQN